MTDLARKLRLPAEGRVAIINAPDGYLAHLDLADAGVGPGYDFVQLFVRSAAELRSDGPGAIRSVRDRGLLWTVFG